MLRYRNYLPFFLFLILALLTPPFGSDFCNVCCSWLAFDHLFSRLDCKLRRDNYTSFRHTNLLDLC
jgi:hypothetical protein